MSVSVVPLADVDPIPLPGDRWSRMLVTGERVKSLLEQGHEPLLYLLANEVAYVVAGAGELRLDDGPVGFRAGDALHIPAGVWHAVANTGDEDVVMVFGFPHPDYPQTERR